MDNDDVITFEEIKNLMNRKTYNSDEVKKIQKILGFKGKDFDGIWGPNTSTAWNKFIKKNKSVIEQAIQDEQKFQNAMYNFGDMTLEELKKLLKGKTDNSDDVKNIQEILGFKDKDVDGIWGKKTSAAWNEFINENKSDIEQAIQDEQKFQNAMAKGQKSPAVEDIVGYSEQLDSYRNAKIAQLEQQIAQVKERIARNERALSGKSYEDVNNKIAALEMNKINSQDPTMIWRWQQQRQDTLNANANAKSKEAEKFANTVDMWVNTRPATTTEGVMQQISNINYAIRDGKNAGADVSRLEAKKKELENLVYGGDNTGSQSDYGAGTLAEQKAAELETALATAKTSAELTNFKKSYKWKPAQLTRLDIRIKELENKEKKRAKEIADKKDFVSWLKSKGHTYDEYVRSTQRTKDTLMDIYKSEKNKKEVNNG